MKDTVIVGCKLFTVRFIIFIITPFFVISCVNSTNTNKVKRNGKSKMDEFQKTMDSLSNEVLKDPSNGKPFFDRANYYMRHVPSIPFDSIIGKTPEQVAQLKKARDLPAINDYLEAISLDYMKKQAYLKLGVVYTFQDDDIALNYFEKSLHEDPNFESAKYEIDLCKKRIEMNQHFY